MTNAINSLRHLIDCYGWRDNRDMQDFIDAADMIDMQYVKLPKDADGEYIHIGDEMEGVDKYDSLKKVRGKVITISFESDGIVDVAIQAWNSDGKSWHRAYLDPDASFYRHYQPDTWERIIEDAIIYGVSDAGGDRARFDALVARCKALAGDAE